MIECASCNTLNPDAELACLACGGMLPPRPSPTEGAALGLARCPAGHPIDPSWKSCPYCDRTSAGSPAPSSSTRLEAALPEPRAAGRKTVLEGAPALSSGLPSTRLEPAAGNGAATRPLLAVLAAPDLGPGGTIFAVRAGKNTLGADRANDIVLGQDSEVSGEHAVILHRNGTFHLTDRLSTNGTWLNGGEVPANGTVPLRDRDRIRCGRAEMVFLVIDLAGAGSE